MVIKKLLELKRWVSADAHLSLCAFISLLRSPSKESERLKGKSSPLLILQSQSSHAHPQPLSRTQGVVFHCYPKASPKDHTGLAFH